MKLINHLRTVHRHRREVRKLCFKCGLYWQGLTHDLSKYSPTEFIPSVRYWTGNRSPIDNEIDDIGYSEAWLHHKGRNKHHYEYWQDYTHGGADGIMCFIPIKYVIEMFCDRVAACKIYQGDNYTNESAYQYFKEHMKVNDIHPKTYEVLDAMLYLLSRSGEDRTCTIIKEVWKKRRTL